VNVRVIAATSRELKPMIAEGTFRSDLYYRLRQLHVQIPPLRQRGDDWRLIVDYFLDSLREHGLVAKTFSGEAMATLQGHSWPGNVREVKSVVDTGFLMSRGNTIDLPDFYESLEELARDHQLGLVTAQLAHECCTLMATGEQTFWQAVHRPFLERDLNRAQVRQVIGEGLTATRGSYKRMLGIFGVEQNDYLKFMDFLRHHDLKPEEAEIYRGSSGVLLPR
jgi:DNA-binding NtrC family response regulator